MKDLDLIFSIWFIPQVVIKEFQLDLTREINDTLVNLKEKEETIDLLYKQNKDLVVYFELFQDIGKQTNKNTLFKPQDKRVYKSTHTENPLFPPYIKLNLNFVY